LNGIGQALSKVKKIPLRRTWNASAFDNPLDGLIKRKPDLTLLDVSFNKQKPKWKNVAALCEITSQPYTGRMQYTIKNKAYISMNEQHDRRYFICLSFFNEASLRIVLCDRAGIITTTTYNIHTDSLRLLRVLTALMFGDDYLVGYDPSMCRGPDDDIISIRVCGVEYRVIKKLFSSSSLRGRATRCWHVEKDGQEYVIKDSWIHEGRTSTS
jgi:hypothetical protein